MSGDACFGCGSPIGLDPQPYYDGSPIDSQPYYFYDKRRLCLACYEPVVRAEYTSAVVPVIPAQHVARFATGAHAMLSGAAEALYDLGVDELVGHAPLLVAHLHRGWLVAEPAIEAMAAGIDLDLGNFHGPHDVIAYAVADACSDIRADIEDATARSSADEITRLADELRYFTELALLLPEPAEGVAA